MRRHIAHDRAFDRSDIGNDGAGGKMRADLLGHCAASANRNADDNQIRACDCGGIRFDHLIRNAKFGNPPARLRRTCGCHDCTRRALGADRTRDR
jgi:hypothetical protein